MSVLFQCPSCRTLGVANAARIDGQRAGLQCAACQAITWLPAAVNGASDERVDTMPFIAPTPAIIAASPPTSDAFAEAQRTAIVRLLCADPYRATTDAQRSLADVFQSTLHTWHDDAAHKRLLQQAAQSGELAFVGQRYRAVLEVVSGEPRAKKGQAEILTLAMASLAQTRDIGTVSGRSGPKASTIVTIVVLVAAVLGVAVVLPKLLARASIATTE